MAQVSYPVRTPLLYWAILGVVTALCLFGAGMVAYSLRLGFSPLLDLAGLALLATPFVYFATTREYRAHGPVHLSQDEVVVPDHRGRPLHFRVPGVRIDLTRVSVRVRVNGIPLGDFSRGTVIEFADAFNKRRLSTLTLVDEDHKDAFLADLERVRRGEAPLGPLSLVPPPPRPQSELEAQLDRELAALD